MKTCSETPNLVKIGHPTRKSEYPLLLPVKLIRQKKCSLRLKWFQAVRKAEEVQTLCERTSMLRYMCNAYLV